MTDFPDTNPFAPPKAPLAELPPSDGGPAYAGRGRRLAATLVDGALGSILLLPMVLTPMAIRSLLYPLNTAFGFWAVFTSFSIGWLVLIAVQAWCFHVGGQTIGKKLVGVRIVRSDGSRAGLVRLLVVRAGSSIVASMIPLIGWLVSLVDSLLIFRASRQCLHDQIADTIVVTAASSMNATLAAERASRAAGQGA